MADRLQVDIITPDSTVLSGKYNMVVVRSVEGELGILAGHIPMIVTLSEWPVKLKNEDGAITYVSVSGGFMEVRNNQISILATAAEMPADIDAKRARAAKKRAEKRLATKGEYDHARAQVALKRAAGRIKTVELSGKAR
ncbi:MAG: F0F1 ATP synthase subunit epsilon [Acidaminococcales bacterium]|jgi:F-type H+-transporting ATPase subunit epsilon|nr:F0F1 ATP synthase subunit epsilon [Acidaminococcales bacterium]